MKVSGYPDHGTQSHSDLFDATRQQRLATMCRKQVPSVQHLKVKCRQLKVVKSFMPWTEKTVELQFLDKHSRQAVIGLEACRQLKMTGVPLFPILGLNEEHAIGPHSQKKLKLLGHHTKIITATKSLFWPLRWNWMPFVCTRTVFLISTFTTLCCGHMIWLHANNIWMIVTYTF